ncbi:MAG: hypothetical protein ACI3ZT_00750 [Candidatus Cryptobacteroides sp.]
MRRIAFAVVSAVIMVLGGSTASAQGKYGADSAECIKYLSYYKEYYKSKNYDSALPNWRKAYSLCPATANQTMLIDGTSLMRRLIVKNASNASYRDALIDSLLTLHRVRAEYYPKYKVTALNNMGLDMANYYKSDPKKLYEGLKSVIDENKEQTKPSVLLINLNAAIQMYQDSGLEADDLINIYQNNMAYLEQAVPADANAKEELEKVKDDMESLFISSKVASCEKIIEVYGPRYEASPDDIALVTNIVKMMSSAENCTDNDLYLNAATSLHKLEPSSQSAYFLYKLNASRGNFDTAIAYLEESLSSTDLDVKTAADYNYEAATYCVKNGKNAKALAFAEKAKELDSSYAGKSYYLIGTIWGSTTCGGDEIAKRSPYWVAVDYMNKAKAADPELADDCNRMISQYRIYFPQTAEAFMYNYTDGQTYTVSCGGMRATTTVRTQK